MLLVLAGLSTIAQAQPGTLTLACKGTARDTTIPDEKPEPITMGLIVNFATRTVQGFGSPGGLDHPVKITAVTDVTIAFEGSDEVGPTAAGIMGSIDRVTGTVEATHTVQNTKTSKILTQLKYDLQCRPTPFPPAHLLLSTIFQ
jgi:hypothetical protein